MTIEQQIPNASIKQEIPQDGSALPLERCPYLYIKTTAAKGIYVKTLKSLPSQSLSRKIIDWKENKQRNKRKF